MGRSRQQAFEFQTWGGRREGAGRPPKGERSGVPHERRPALSRHHPVHVTLRTVAEVGRLRTRDRYRIIRQALVTSFAASRSAGLCRIVHLSIQGNHLHLLVEAEDREALSRGVQGFEISCAKRINNAISQQTGETRRGAVFADRFHAVQLKTPRQVRSCIAYVLSNWRRHGEPTARDAALDAYATGWHFDGWAEALPAKDLDASSEILPVWFPKVWLLTQGWRRHGPISAWHAPGPPS